MQATQLGRRVAQETPQIAVTATPKAVYDAGRRDCICGVSPAGQVGPLTADVSDIGFTGHRHTGEFSDALYPPKERGIYVTNAASTAGGIEVGGYKMWR